MRKYMMAFDNYCCNPELDDYLIILYKPYSTINRLKSLCFPDKVVN